MFNLGRGTFFLLNECPLPSSPGQKSPHKVSLVKLNAARYGESVSQFGVSGDFTAPALRQSDVFCRDCFTAKMDQMGHKHVLSLWVD